MEKKANELTYRRRSDYRRPWKPATPETSPVHCRPLADGVWHGGRGWGSGPPLTSLTWRKMAQALLHTGFL